MNILKRIFKSKKHLNDQKVIDDILSGKITKIGIYDNSFEPSGCGGFPYDEAEFVRVANYEKGIICVRMTITKKFAYIEASLIYREYKRESN